MARLETEHDNLRAALAWALGSDDVDVFVRLAVAPGRPERAARLLGTAAAWFDARGTIIGQTERAEHDGSIAPARVQLGDEVFAAAWAAGQAMPLDADSCRGRRCLFVLCEPCGALDRRLTRISMCEARRAVTRPVVRMVLAVLMVVLTACGGAPAVPPAAALVTQVPTAPLFPATTISTTTPAATGVPEARSTGPLLDVPCNRTLVLGWGIESPIGVTNRWAVPGYTHQEGNNLLWEGLSYYAIFADKEIPWLADRIWSSPSKVR